MEFKDEKKQLFRATYNLAKQIESHLASLSNIDDIFSEDINQKRQKLVQKCESLVFLDHDSLGKKSREILWRQGCYNSISRVKQILWKNQRKLTTDEIKAVREFLYATINIYKSIIVKFENRFDLDLRYVINIDGIGKKITNRDDSSDDQEAPSLTVIDYALKTIHFMLIALGDIHRYLYGFDVTEINGHKLSTFKIAADFYTEAFKLNPTIGMAQNQLGTLYAGKNHDLDSIFHYLFALCCRIPFDLSEDNIGKIFQNNIDYIETNDEKVEDADKVCVRDFIARFILNVDIFFYDKTVADFNNLCHYNLIELKKLLNTRLSEIDENFLFKITSILFFCMSHLKSHDSNKIHSLNALMVALTSELVDSCIKNIENFISDYSAENYQFQIQYDKMYEKYEQRVTHSRQKKIIIAQNEKEDNNLKITNYKSSNSLSNEKSTSNSSQDNLTQKSIQEKSVTPSSTQDSKEKLKSSSKKLSTTKDRRRRKKIQNSSDSDSEDLISDFESDNDKENIDSDFSDDVSNSESDESFSSDDEDIDETIINNNNNNIPDKLKKFDNEDSDIDVIVEEENIIYFNGNDNEDVIIENETIVFNNDDNFVETEESLPDTPPTKLKYVPKYNKTNPNIILRFAQFEKTLKSLNILFAWLRNNNSDILMKCHESNPELIHKIIKMLNYLNIDIYTKKVYFDLSLLKVENLRADSYKIFENRQTIPLSEDITLKAFDLFEPNQRSFDWEMNSKLKITKNEESLIRILKLVDFGFYLTKSNKFNYVFCKKQRSFIGCKSNSYDGGNVDTRSRRKRRRRGENKRNNNIDVDGKSNNENRYDRTTRRSNRRTRRERRSKIMKPLDMQMQQPKVFVSRDNTILTRGADDVNEKGMREGQVKSPLESTKSEIMGKLWLRDEIKNLESLVKKPANMTPYLVMDSKCLTMYTHIVRSLVKTKKFIILIPNAVFSELDELKKYTEGARNAIRWLEQEFKRGNRHIRSQRDDETLPLPMIKFPKKLDRESSSFLQIVQFCHYIVSNNSSHDLLTFVTGESLTEKKCNNFSFSGIIEAIGVKTELISTFYSKYRKK